MNLKYLGKYEGEDLSPISFWFEPTRYDFEILFEDSEDVNIFEEEFKLNCKKQLEEDYIDIRFKP